jgi:hypothetical protein
MVPVFYAYQEGKMAAIKLIALHVNKSKGASAGMHERLAKEAAAQMDHLLSNIK